MATPLKLVPFNSAWINNDKIDVHAIYRRPRFVEDKYGDLKRQYDANGVPTWDLTGGLPVRSDTRWRAKGFEYVTLADRASLVSAARAGTIEGDWRQYDQHQRGGPWNGQRYLDGQEEASTNEARKLREDVHKYGSEAVEEIRRQREPDFVLPNHLRGIAPGTPQQPSESAQAASPAPEPVAAVAAPVAEKRPMPPALAAAAAKKKAEATT